MIRNLISPKEYTVYPGEYVPIPEKEVSFEELLLLGETSPQLLVNMDELKDCFKIEVVAPGAEREDIFIHVENNILSIVVLYKDHKNLQHERLHEFKAASLERHILLPAKADAEFVTARYNQGMLRIYLSKTEEPAKGALHQIMVY